MAYVTPLMLPRSRASYSLAGRAGDEAPDGWVVELGEHRGWGSFHQASPRPGTGDPDLRVFAAVVAVAIVTGAVGRQSGE